MLVADTGKDLPNPGIIHPVPEQTAGLDDLSFRSPSSLQYSRLQTPSSDLKGSSTCS